MFRLIKIFVALLNFYLFLGTTFLSLNNEPCMIRPALIG